MHIVDLLQLPKINGPLEFFIFFMSVFVMGSTNKYPKSINKEIINIQS